MINSGIIRGAGGEGAERGCNVRTEAENHGESSTR